MSSSDGNIYINDLTTGNELSPFELVTDSTTNPTTSLITPNTTKAGYAVESTSFVVGSDRLDNDNNAEDKKDTRMFFDKPKGAFRAGTVTGTQWNDGNRGTNSTALGLNNIARGENSFAAGSTNIANGTNSFAAGISNAVNGDNSVAAGNNNNTNGDNSVAIGLTNIVSGGAPASVSAAIGTSNSISTSSTGSFAIGKSNYASGPGNQSVLIGVSNTTVDGDNGVAIGEYNTTSADNATAIGQYCTASGANSFAIGYGTDIGTTNTASGTGSVAIGNLNTSSNSNSVALGQYCTASGANSVSIGYGDSPSVQNTAGSTGSIAIGHINTSIGSSAVAIGIHCQANANESFAIGHSCVTNAAASFAIGAAATTSTANNIFSLFWNGHCMHGGIAIPHTMSGGAGSAEFVCSHRGAFRVMFGVDDDSISSGLGAVVNVNSATGYSWSTSSDINLKENLVEHNYSDTLDKIMDMPIYTYNFKSVDPGIKSIGPVAQDFNRLFPSDKDQLSIVERDMCGVALAGVKGVKLGLDNLSTSVDSRFASNSDATSALQSRIAVLESSLTTASAQIAAMESRLAALEQ